MLSLNGLYFPITFAAFEMTS